MGGSECLPPSYTCQPGKAGIFLMIAYEQNLKF
jgi:hypothetical protein